jgi:hypothetical protein
MRSPVALSIRYIEYFWFLGCIRVARFVSRVSVRLGDVISDVLGVTSACCDAREWVRSQPQTGNPG